MASSCMQLLCLLLAFIVAKPISSLSKFEEYIGDCPKEYHQKGVVLSLFGTIAALNQIKQEGLYDVDYSLAFGTLIAFHRNNTLLPWDTDSDIAIIFKNDLNQTQLKQFGKVLQQKLREALGTPQIGRVKWMFQRKHEQIRYHTMWARAVNGSLGMLDIFVFFHGDREGQVLTWHPLHHLSQQHQNRAFYVNESVILPIKHNVPWPAYGGFKVNIPESVAMLEISYGTDWRIPNVGQNKLNCSRPNQSTVERWMSQIVGIDDEQSTAAIDHASPSAEIVGDALAEQTVLMYVDPPVTWYHAWQLIAYCTVICLFCRIR